MNYTENLKSILLVDDDESSNFLHSIFINKLPLDVEVNSALNGQEALDFILGKGAAQMAFPCMVLLDLNMPVMDGWDFIEKYAEQVPLEIREQIKVVLVTISDDKNDIARAKANSDIVDYAQKPLSDKKFKALIKKHFSFEMA